MFKQRLIPTALGLALLFNFLSSRTDAAPFPTTKTMVIRYMMGVPNLTVLDQYIARNRAMGAQFVFYPNGTFAVNNGNRTETGTYAISPDGLQITCTLTSFAGPYGPLSYLFYKTPNTANGWWGTINVSGKIWGYDRGVLN